MVVTGQIKGFIPEQFKKFIPVLSMILGFAGAMYYKLDGVETIIAIVGAPVAYGASKGIKKDDLVAKLESLKKN